MRLPVILSFGEDGWVVAECPVLPGCVSQGRTRKEAIANIKEAIELWLDGEAAGFELSVEYAEVEVTI